MRVLVIIPAYNERGNIEGVVSSLKAVCPDADYVVINDCSTDDTAAVCEERNIRYVNLPVNLGIGGGVQTGYLYGLQNGYDITVQLDGDGQHDPSYLGQLLQPIIEDQADMVIGSRFIENNGFQSSSARRAGIRFLSALIHICSGAKVRDVTSGFRACNKQLTALFAANYAQDYPEPEAIIDAVKSGFRVMEVPVTMHERQNGKSSINALRSVYYMIKVSIAVLLHSMRGKKGE